MKRSLVCYLVASLVAFGTAGAACAQGAPPASPTKAAEPTKAAAPPQPTKAPPTVTAVPTKASEPTKAAAGPVAPADFPQKGRTLTIIVPFAAGGGSDLIVRTISPLLERDLGIPVVVVNKAGASTQVGTAEMVRSKPDGYTLSIATLITTAVTYMDPERQASYSRKDLQHVANLVVEDMVLTTKEDSPYGSVKDLVDAAKANPGAIKIGTTGLMGIGHLTALALQQAAGVQFSYVHFDGAAPATTALLGGHVDATCTGAGTVLGQVKGGTLKVLGYFDDQQSKFFPDIKPITVQGYNVVVPAAYGVLAPAGTPMPIVNYLSALMKSAVEDEDVVRKFAELGFTPRYMNPAQFAAYWDSREAQARPLIDLARK